MILRVLAAHELLHGQVDKLVLRLRLHHARALGAQLENRALDVDLAVDAFAFDLIEQQIDHNERARAADARAAVHNDRATQLERLLLGVHLVQKAEHTARIGGYAVVGPGGEVKVVDRATLLLLLILFGVVLQLEFAQRKVGRLLLAERVHGHVSILARLLAVGPISYALVLASLHLLGGVDDHVAILVPHHRPKVTARVGQRALRGDVLLVGHFELGKQKVSVDDYVDQNNQHT